jgi:hypothetical protein
LPAGQGRLSGVRWLGPRREKSGPCEAAFCDANGNVLEQDALSRGEAETVHKIMAKQKPDYTVEVRNAKLAFAFLKIPGWVGITPLPGKPRKVAGLAPETITVRPGSLLRKTEFRRLPCCKSNWLMSPKTAADPIKPKVVFCRTLFF